MIDITGIILSVIAIFFVLLSICFGYFYLLYPYLSRKSKTVIEINNKCEDDMRDDFEDDFNVINDDDFLPSVYDVVEPPPVVQDDSSPEHECWQGKDSISVEDTPRAVVLSEFMKEYVARSADMSSASASLNADVKLLAEYLCDLRADIMTLIGEVPK